MSKLITFFLFLFIGSSILSAVMEGGGGINAVELKTAIDNDDTVIEVDSTDGFLSADYLIIGDEKILYSGLTSTTFTGATRGYDGTTATSHAAGDMVFNAEGSAVNSALGFNIAATNDTMGMWAVITIPWNFMTKTVPRIVMMNWSFLSGDLALVGWFFYAAGAGLVITLALSLAGGRRV